MGREYGSDARHDDSQTRRWVEIARSLSLPEAPVVLTGPGARIVRVSGQAAELLGPRADDLVGRSCADVAVRCGPHLRLIGSASVVVHCVSWPHETDARFRVNVLVDASGSAGPPGSVSLWADAESVGRVGGFSLQDVQRAARIGTWEWDPSTDLVRYSDVASDVVGIPGGRSLTMSEAMGRVLPEDLPVVEDSLNSLLASRNAVPAEWQCRIMRPNGSLRTIGFHAASRVREDGSVGLVGVVQEIADPKTLRSRSGYDVRTGLPDDRTAVEVLGRLLDGPHYDRVAVLVCAPDQLTRIGHSLGYGARDELSSTLAGRLREGLPENCTVTRGPEESTFIVLCPDVVAVGGLEAVTAKAAGLLRTTATVAGHSIRISASIGIARSRYGQGTAEDLLRYASVAANEAKQRGPDEVVLANLDLIAEVDQQLPVERQLRDALANDQLTLHYQPIVDADGSIRRAEALLRWQHAHYGLLRPAYFLPAARRGNLLRDLDLWVLRRALRDAARWPHVNGEPLSVSVNLAGFLPGEVDFVDLVADAVATAGVEWNQLVLELVETDLVDLRPHTRAAMERLVENGVQFAIDDFGTGYSSLARLKDLPAQIVKLDRRFVTDIAVDRTDYAIAQAVCTMAHVMGRQCTAEGVETSEQLRTLETLGIDDYQGFLFSRAIPEPELQALLAGGGELR